MEAQEILQVIRGTVCALVGFEWQPFARCAVLRLRDGGGKSLTLRLDGLHFVAMRQSLFGQWSYIPIGDKQWEDWGVAYVDLQQGGEFLERFLAGDLGLSSQIVVYSSNGAQHGDEEFLQPIHLSLVTSGGNLDAICESVRMDE
jgi:hypothetical protein